MEILTCCLARGNNAKQTKYKETKTGTGAEAYQRTGNHRRRHRDEVHAFEVEQWRTVWSSAGLESPSKPHRRLTSTTCWRSFCRLRWHCGCSSTLYERTTAGADFDDLVPAPATATVQLASPSALAGQRPSEPIAPRRANRRRRWQCVSDVATTTVVLR